jgi:predicted Fe-Mo cluster-binding NifX family protein
MKIAVPTMGNRGIEEKVAEHFGRCENYVILNEKKEVVEIIENISAHNGGSGLPPELLKEKGVSILLCLNLGPKALRFFQDFNIQVYVDLASTVGEITVGNIFDKWKNNLILQASNENVCKEHLQ